MSSRNKAFFLTFYFFIYHVSAFSLSKFDITETVGFVREDNQRDTISLLISCFATLGLCVYSAVHLNVPPKGESNGWTLLREFRWCIIGLFAPELILYTAWRQLASARQLRHEVEQARGTKEIKSVPKEEISSVCLDAALKDAKHDPWTIAHGFYGTMGGFAIDIDPKDHRHSCLFENTRRLTLTAKGVALLAHCGHFPDVALDDIKDKNKADGLAKLLVCIQAGWMIVQVITRTAIGLPTSLLEVHTVAHVVCALIMYVIWWHKPRQVASPTLLRSEKLWPLATYMYLASRMSGEPPAGALGRFLNPKPEMKKLAYFMNTDTVALKDDTQLSIRRLSTAHTTDFGHFGPRPAGRSGREPLSPMPLDEIKLEQRRLAAEAVATYPALRSHFSPSKNDPSSSETSPYLVPYATELMQPHSLDWPNAGLLRRTQSLIMGMVLWGASMAYGAIHVSAWNYFFPSDIEQLFWHLSSVWVTFCAAFWLLTNLLAHFFPLIDKVWVAYNERRLGWVGTGVITMLCMLCGVSYIVSRMYLVLEAFVSIREVPSEVYLTPAWSQVFPHL